MTQPATVSPLLSQSSPSAEPQYMRLIAQGGRNAFAAFYDCYSTPLYSLALRVVNDTKDAEEVLQEVFLTIWEKAANFDETIGNSFNWAASMTRNKAIDRLRSKRCHAQMFAEATESAVLEATSFVVEPAVDRDQIAQIPTAVTGLPDDQYRAIELAFFGGLTHFEIADVLEEAPDTIQTRIRSGMLRLRDCLANHLMDRHDDL